MRSGGFDTAAGAVPDWHSGEPEKTCAELLARVRCEFLEMPGLRLTAAQAARLWDVDYHTACGLLQALVGTRFLMPCRNGAYARWSA